MINEAELLAWLNSSVAGGVIGVLAVAAFGVPISLPTAGAALAGAVWVLGRAAMARDVEAPAEEKEEEEEEEEDEEDEEEGKSAEDADEEEEEEPPLLAGRGPASSPPQSMEDSPELGAGDNTDAALE